MTSEHELSDYLLGELDAETHVRFEQRLREDPELRARAERLRPLVGQLEAMPQDAWETLPAESAPAVARSRRRRRVLTLRPLVAAGAATALLAVGVAGGLLADGGGSSPQGPTVALSAVDGAPASSSALARMTGGGHMLLKVRGLPPAKPGTYYEAWLMSDGTHLVPVASFTVDDSGQARIDVPLPASASDYRYIDISLQRTAAGTAHSSTSVLRGALS
jgi:anti-sigma-K factor RskA